MKRTGCQRSTGGSAGAPTSGRARVTKARIRFMRASIRGRPATSALPLAGRGTHLYGSAMRCDRIWRNARLATMTPTAAGLGIVEDGLVACRDGDIVYAGPAAGAPATLDALEVVDCGRRWITPGLIDCHTH